VNGRDEDAAFDPAKFVRTRGGVSGNSVLLLFASELFLYFLLAFFAKTTHLMRDAFALVGSGLRQARNVRSDFDQQLFVNAYLPTILVLFRAGLITPSGCHVIKHHDDRPGSAAACVADHGSR